MAARLFRSPLGLFSKTWFQRGGRHEHPKAASDRHRLRRGVPVVLHRQAPHRERAGAGAGCSAREPVAAVLPPFLGCSRRLSPRSRLAAAAAARRLATAETVYLIPAQAKNAHDKGISGVPTSVFAQKSAVS